jgi:hypothetical protein
VKVSNNRKPTTNSKIVRINPDSWYPKVSIRDKAILGAIAEDIRKIVLSEGLRKICIITFKDKSIIDTLKTLLSDFDLSFQHFGNLRTRNDFRNEKVGFVVGNYNVNKDKWQENYENATLKQDSDKRYKFDNEMLEAKRINKEDDENYHAIHRFGLLNKETTIYIYGILPDKIRNEPITYIEMSRDKLRSSLNNKAKKNGHKVKISDIELLEAMNEIVPDKKKSLYKKS